MSLRVLHLLSNWKLTGPVAPALELAGALRARGHEVHAAVGRPLGDGLEPAGDHARHQGLQVVGGLTLSKHFRVLDNLRDVRRLRRMVAAEGYDVVHVHGTNDHLLAAAMRRGGPRCVLVRSFHGGDVRRVRRRDRLLVTRAADALVVPSAAEEAWARRIRPDLAGRAALLRLSGAVDLERFDPGRLEVPSRPTHPFRVGVVARVQTHRRFEDILAALEELVARGRKVQLVVVGRGTHYDRLLCRPVAERGLGPHVELAGYLTGEDYVAKLLTLDAAVYLVPGSDGTCRAVRELMALGRAVIVARRGMLPELVEAGASGLVLEGDGTATLAAAIERLARDPALVARLGRAARTRALRDFDPARQAAQVEALYERARSEKNAPGAFFSDRPA
ncbi:MAG: glycosyltransferase family 4 protein [Planctomycetes bacterium]|nr:glycosyltransferase family 4 protein [Planctomycetota bacterium]